MSPPRNQIAVVGIGSPNGDDAIGWQVVDGLNRLNLENTELHKTQNPLDLLDFLDVYKWVHIIDAAVGLSSDDRLRRLEYAKRADRVNIEHIASRGTHDATVSHALRLAQALGKSIDHVTLWIGNGIKFEPFDDLSIAASESITEITEVLGQELCHA